MAAKRYTNLEQIDAAIDETRSEARELLSRAESFELTATLLVKIPGSEQEAKNKREQAEAFRVTAANLVNKRLPKLGAKRSTFLTTPLAGVLPDSTVPQKL